MIVVKVELHSAVTGAVTEIGRMVISNDGTGTSNRGNYDARLMRRGTVDRVQRRGRIEGYPRKSLSVWTLVARALQAVGFGSIDGGLDDPGPTVPAGGLTVDEAIDITGYGR